MKRLRLPARFFGPQHFQAPMSKAEEEKALLAAIISGSDDAIFSKTLDAIITSWNRGAQRMYGYTAEEIIGHPVSMLVPPDRPNDVPSIMKRIRAGESLDHYDTVRRHKDGSLLHVSLTISPIRDRKGEIVGASTIARDMTSRRLAEEALRASEKLVAMGRMAASIAHEIRNPLDAAKNLTYLLQQSAELNPSTRDMLNLLDNQLTHMGEICSRTLTFARPGDAPARVSLAAIVDEVFALQRKNLAVKGIEVARRFESVGEVVGYPGPLRQVLVNLISNAIDAIPAGRNGRITVHMMSAHHPVTGVEGERITLSDNGVGIKPEYLNRLFQPFFSTKREEGTGLGLWVSYGIVTQHGGSIRVRSRVEGPARGTVFSIFLPRLGARINGNTQAA
ncbi:MAG: PAS domain S-box protein [Acetobacteraceae bacterium]|nr:PAS domain S-box protein [Acetobacteraceae bacterium]